MSDYWPYIWPESFKTKDGVWLRPIGSHADNPFIDKGCSAMSELTPKANALLIEYQNYIEEGYEATEDEWAAFGKKAVSALYETERVIATQAAEIEALRKIWKKVEKDRPGEVFVVAFWPDEYFEFDAALSG